jgi:hypothetical protein
LIHRLKGVGKTVVAQVLRVGVTVKVKIARVHGTEMDLELVTTQVLALQVVELVIAQKTNHTVLAVCFAKAHLAAPHR